MCSSVVERTDEIRAVRGAWPGGPCPKCGDDMPANVVHCMTCRHMLNSELKDDEIPTPEFVPLPEIKTTAEVVARGHYVKCLGCSETLRINAKYMGVKVQCRHCSQVFNYDAQAERVAAYAKCPHCSSEIRAGMQYLNQTTSCKFCSGHLVLRDPAE